jgi:hypothetical protein
LIKGKVYTQADLQNYERVSKRTPASFFVDDNGCSRDIEELLKEKKIVEI